jgi:hypothetical protein
MEFNAEFDAANYRKKAPTQAITISGGVSFTSADTQIKFPRSPPAA